MAGIGAIITIVIILAVLALIIIPIIWGFITYNKLVRLRNTVEESFAQIATQLQRRFDLIPNIVETVKAYAAHENSTLVALTAARSNAESAMNNAKASGSVADAAAADKALSGAAMQINAVAEAYPALTASANFQQLQEELATTENKVAFSRQNFNESVMEYNTKVESVPSNLIAKIGKFTKKEMFTVESEEVKKAPKVTF